MRPSDRAYRGWMAAIQTKQALGLLPPRPASHVLAPTLRTSQLRFDEHHHRALALLVQSICQRRSINLRLVPALAEYLQVETVADIVTDLVEAFASHAGTEAEQS